VWDFKDVGVRNSDKEGGGLLADNQGRKKSGKEGADREETAPKASEKKGASHNRQPFQSGRGKEDERFAWGKSRKNESNS